METSTIPLQIKNTEALRDELLQIRPGCTKVSFWALTIADQYKRDPADKTQPNPYYPIKKLAHVSGLLQFDYHTNVKRAMERKGLLGDAWEGGESWHEPVMMDGKWTALAQHKKTGEAYLRVRPEKSLEKPRYFSGDGIEMTEQLAKQYLKPVKKESKRQSEAGLEEGEQIGFRLYKLESIVSLTHRDVELEMGG